MQPFNMLSKLQHFRRVFRFLISGGSALFVNLSLLYFFADILHVWYLTASIVAFVGAFTVSFFLQKLWTFDNRSFDALHIQMGVSLAVALGNLFLNTLLMYVFVEHFSLHHILAQIISSALIACESFFLYKHVVFVSRLKE